MDDLPTTDELNAELDPDLDARASQRPARALVYVSVSGGIADALVIRGDANVVLIDWDNVEDDENEELIEEYLEVAREFLPEYDTVVADLEERLAEIRKNRDDSAEAERNRRRLDRERAAETLGIVLGSPAWLYYVEEAPDAEY